jgi:hypothetical protein
MSDFLESLLVRGTIPTPDLAAGSIQPRPLSLYERPAMSQIPSDLEAGPGLGEAYDFPASDRMNQVGVKSFDKEGYRQPITEPPLETASLKNTASSPGPDETVSRLRPKITSLENISPASAYHPLDANQQPTTGTLPLPDKETKDRRAFDTSEPADESAPRSTPSSYRKWEEGDSVNQPNQPIPSDPFPKRDGSSILPIRPLLPNDPGSNREMNGHNMPGLEMGSYSEIQAAPSIQVSIGRIEVRLAQPLTAPKRQPSRQASAVMSLEEYLRQRDGGRS